MWVEPRNREVDATITQSAQTGGTVPYRQVRAVYTPTTITVYQAYSDEIAHRALATGTFVPPFKRDRMTWIKPSFLWMMYRSGWATKPGQEQVLAIAMTRKGFEWALAHSSLSHFESSTYASEQEWAKQKQINPVRVQWDPERSLTLASLNHRTIQVGLGAPVVQLYVERWITTITDITGQVHEIRRLVNTGNLDAARSLLPDEHAYPLSNEIREAIAATNTSECRLTD
ncbi:MAG: DUF4291 domain-containing protein [Pseudonocardiaceae bacterium]